MQPTLKTLEIELSSQVNEFNSLVAKCVSDTNVSGLDASQDLEQIKTRAQAILNQRKPVLEAFTTEVVSNLVGIFYQMENKNISYFAPTTPGRKGIRLVKTRTKNVDRLVDNLLAGKEVNDGQGLAVVADTWGQIDREVRPYLQENFMSDPSLAKFYRDDVDNMFGYSRSQIVGKNPSGYEAEHLVLYFPGQDGSLVPISVHLHSTDAFVEAEWGKAALSRHLKDDIGSALTLSQWMGIGNDAVLNLLKKNEYKTIVTSTGSKVWYMGNGYNSKADHCRERVMESEKGLPLIYTGIRRMMGEEGLSGYPDLGSDEATRVVNEVMSKYPSLTQHGIANGEVNLVRDETFTRLAGIANYNIDSQRKKTSEELRQERQSLQQEETRERQMMMNALH
ncbi:hypothetical protein HOC35_05385 [Candidatus Woesearchaeota archaeon]|nr:hypothetical protein [Candidatus Woesearchaeota archaeon]